MKAFNLKILTAFILILLSVKPTSAQSAHDIMVQADNRPDGDTRKSVMKMELTNKRGSTRVRTMLSYSKDYGKDRKSIMFFQAPADVKGTGFLTWDYNDENKTDDRWLYIPAMKKTRRISGTSAKKEYFMGSDFTYDDMGNRDVEADNHTLLHVENVNGASCWVIQSEPKSSDETYSKTISWIRKDNYIVAKAEFYDKMGSLQKVLTVSEIKQINGFWTATKMTMTNNQRQHKTVISISNMQYNVSVSDNQFTVNSLEKGYIE